MRDKIKTMAEVIGKAIAVLLILPQLSTQQLQSQFIPGAGFQQQIQSNISGFQPRQQFSSGPPVFASASAPSNIAGGSIDSRVSNTNDDAFKRIASGGQQFGLEMFTILSDTLEQAQAKRDVMISPYAVWSLLLLIAEGAAGDTLKELQRTLRLDDSDQIALRSAYRDITRYLTVNTSTIEVASMQALFTDINQPVKRDYENLIERNYGAQLVPVDFHDVTTTYKRINDDIRIATRGLIPYAVNGEDLRNTNLFMISALYFKGQWKHFFNRSKTHTEMFYDEDGNPLRQVEMMTQEAAFNFAGISELQAHVLELPYGKEDRLVMLIVLPRNGVKLNQVVHNLNAFGIPLIFTRLKEASIGYEEDDVEVIMPKFSTSTDLSIPRILETMGISKLFQPHEANLSRMSTNFFVSQVIHATKIIVNEEGTEAAAVTGAVLINKSTPPKFHMNRPFLYMIIEKRTNVLLFAGQVVNPK